MMAYGQVNADVIGTSVAGSNLGAGNASLMKSRIINGAMVIDQRNAGASVTPTIDVYTLDRWNAECAVASKYSVQQNAGSVTPPVGFTNYLGVTSTSAYSVGSGDFFSILQPIEGYNLADLGWGSANAKTITVSFWVRSSLTGTFGGAIENSAGNRSYPFSYTISSANTWTQVSVTVVGDTTGTWLTTNGRGLTIRFSLGCGSTYAGTAGSWGSTRYFGVTGQQQVVGTNGATLYLTGVQLEVGSSATGFEYENYTSLLNKCQRYYEVFYQDAGAYSPLSLFRGAADYTAYWFFKVEKRAAAAVTKLAGTWGGSTPTIYGGISEANFTSTSAFYLNTAGNTATLAASAEL